MTYLTRVVPYSEERIGNLYDLYDRSYNKDDYVCDGDKKRIAIKMFYSARPVIYKKSTSKKTKSIKHKKSGLIH